MRPPHADALSAVLPTHTSGRERISTDLSTMCEGQRAPSRWSRASWAGSGGSATENTSGQATGIEDVEAYHGCARRGRGDASCCPSLGGRCLHEGSRRNTVSRASVPALLPSGVSKRTTMERSSEACRLTAAATRCNILPIPVSLLGWFRRAQPVPLLRMCQRAEVFARVARGALIRKKLTARERIGAGSREL